MNKIHRNDEVFILSGRDKGKSGVVAKIINGADGKEERVVVKGVNLVTHYVRPNPQKNEPGGMVKREASLHVSNVAMIDPGSRLPSRVKIKIDEAGKKTRIFHVSKRRSQ